MNGRFFTALAALGMALAVAGCQSSDTGNVLNIGKKKEPVPDTRITQEELLAECPRVTLREGTAYFTQYAKGHKDDKDYIVYQASIGDVTRSCQFNGDMMTMTVAVAGKIVLGPKGTPGNIVMPIRVAAAQGSQVLYSQLHKHTVQISGGGATQFIFTDSQVTFPKQPPRSVIVFAGYDEGPYNTK
ncbi:MAG: hypothetical protein KDJ74_13535 [Notoacmeibacter sp.]|nr:hypothetical protein [Notoacmeibacter sp.]